MKNEIPPVSTILHENGVPHKVFVHPGPLHSLEQAAQERKQSPDQIVRSILFRISQGEYAMVLTSGPKQINWKLLRKHLGANRITMASQNEVLNVTGYPLGAVAPFGLNQPVRILIDKSILKQQIVSMGSGVRGTAIILKSKDFIQALGDIEMGKFV
jgi:Cys-tRNA(Pro) deacylase